MQDIHYYVGAGSGATVPFSYARLRNVVTLDGAIAAVLQEGKIWSDHDKEASLERAKKGGLFRPWLVTIATRTGPVNTSTDRFVEVAIGDISSGEWVEMDGYDRWADSEKESMLSGKSLRDPRLKGWFDAHDGIVNP